MTKQLDEFLKTFKPEFGNEQHLQILELIAKAKKKESLVTEKLTNQKAIERNLKEVDRAENQIIFLIKKHK